MLSKEQKKLIEEIKKRLMDLGYTKKDSVMIAMGKAECSMEATANRIRSIKD